MWRLYFIRTLFLFFVFTAHEIAVSLAQTCNDVHTPAVQYWNDTRYYSKTTNTTLPAPFYDANHVNISSTGVQLSCSIPPAINRLTCGWLSSTFTDAGPFYVMTMMIEWPAVIAPEKRPGFVWRKKLTNDYFNDTITFSIVSLNSTRLNTSMAVAGGGSANFSQGTPDVSIDGLPGLHNITIFWDNHTIIYSLDGQRLHQMYRTEIMKLPGGYWPQLRGYVIFFTTYPHNDTFGANSYFFVRSLDTMCISPDASFCFTQPNPLPGVAICDLRTATWSASGPISLNISTTPLDLPGITLTINGTIDIGSGGIAVDPSSVLNVTGDVTFGGPLILNISGLSLDAGNRTIVIANYGGNSVGNFTTIQLINANHNSCIVYEVTPQYDSHSFAVLLQAELSSSEACRTKPNNSKHKKTVIIIAVTCGIVFLAILTALVLGILFKDSIICKRKARRKYSLRRELTTN